MTLVVGLLLLFLFITKTKCRCRIARLQNLCHPPLATAGEGGNNALEAAFPLQSLFLSANAALRAAVSHPAFARVPSCVRSCPVPRSPSDIGTGAKTSVLNSSASLSSPSPLSFQSLGIFAAASNEKSRSTKTALPFPELLNARLAEFGKTFSHLLWRSCTLGMAL